MKQLNETIEKIYNLEDMKNIDETNDQYKKRFENCENELSNKGNKINDLNNEYQHIKIEEIINKK